MIEWLSLTIPQGELLSMPLALEDRQRPEGASAHHEQDRLRAAPTQEFFIVVDKYAGRKKFVRTAAWSTETMAMPVSLQAVSRWQEDDQVYHDGCPKLVDLVTLANWPVLRWGLRRWPTAQGSTPGCVGIGQSSPLLETSAEEGWRAGEVSTLALLDALASSGWSRAEGRPPREHTADSPRVFRVEDPLERKAYLRCLVGLDQLREVGQLTKLRSDQSASYYQCVLAADQPASVPVDADSGVYSDFLKGKCEPLPIADAENLMIEDQAPSEHAHAVADSPAAGVSSSSDELELCGETRPAAMARPKAKAAKAKSKPKARAGVVAGDEWASLVAWPVPAVSPEPVGSAGAESAGASSSGGAGQVRGGAGASSADASAGVAAASSSAAGAAGGEAAPVGGDVVARVAREGGDAAAAPRPAPIKIEWIEGARVLEEKHKEIGMPGAYDRVGVICGHADHAADRSVCRKRRNFGVRAASANLGRMEPYAYLGAWLRAASLYPDAASHKRFSPSDAAVQAYATEQGWA